MNLFIPVLCFYLALFNIGTAQIPGQVAINPAFRHAAAIQSIIDRYSEKDLPGAAVAVYSDLDGWWTAAAGFAKTESQTRMKPSNLQYLQSVSKTFMAVAILQLYEQKKIRLDAAITSYLPSKYKTWIPNADSITVRMLLNHTSGIAEYVSDPEYTETVLLKPLKLVNMNNVLRCLQDEQPQFAPGTRYSYTNTNYALLALIADQVTGDHARYITRNILKPAGLTNTFYRDDRTYLKNPALVDSYWDLLNAGRPANITAMQKTNVGALIGDDGLICTPVDAVIFLRSVMQGKLLSDSCMKLMQTWVKNDQGREVYGMGLIKFEIDGQVGYGHGGGGLGAGCALIYVPAKEVYVFIATNIGVITEGNAGIKANAMKDEILKILLN